MRRSSATTSSSRQWREQMNMPDFDDDLRERVERAVRPGKVIETLGIARPNRIVSIDRDGVRVETERSIVKGTGPQLVPAWMIVKAWEHLCRYGRLSNQELLNGLNVKRSAFVSALLSRFPEVEVESSRPIVLRLRVAEPGEVSERTHE